jgi:hypothetical protein
LDNAKLDESIEKTRKLEIFSSIRNEHNEKPRILIGGKHFYLYSLSNPKDTAYMIAQFEDLFHLIEEAGFKDGQSMIIEQFRNLLRIR